MSAHELIPPATAPFALTVDSGGDRIPTTGGSPRLSWKVPVGGAADRYEIDAVVDDRLLPLAEVSSSAFVEWPWAALASRSRVELAGPRGPAGRDVVTLGRVRGGPAR